MSGWAHHAVPAPDYEKYEDSKGGVTTMEGESEVDDGVYDTSLLLLLLSIVCIENPWWQHTVTLIPRPMLSRRTLYIDQRNRLPAVLPPAT